jgi:hypothetical protein
MIKRLLAGLAAAAILATAVVAPSHSADDEATWDGLQKVKSKKLDVAFLLPGADFRVYTKVIIDPLEVAFRKNWERDMNRASRSARERVSAEDADRIRKEMAEGFHEILVEDFRKAGYEVVTAPGPDVMRLRPGLAEVWINAPDTMQAGRSYSYTVEAGEATLVLEALDSETNQLLGRVVDQRRTGQTAMWTRTTSVTNRAEFSNMFKQWSRTLTSGFEALKDASPIQPKQKK